jgi:hypothetical protein
MFKNTAGQKLIVYAFDSTTNLPKTGDAANITAYVSKDYGAVTVLTDTTATEMDATNAKGYYLFDLAQAETNGDTLLFSAKSATANIVVLAMPATVFTVPPNFTALAIATSGQVGLNYDNVKQATGPTTLTNITVPTVNAVAAGGITPSSFTAATGLVPITSDTATAGGASTITFNTTGSLTTDFYKGTTVLIVSGTGLGQSRVIIGYNGTTKVATVDRAWAVNPDATSVYVVLALGTTGAAGSVAFPSNFGVLGIGATGHVTNVDTLTTYTGNTPQTGDVYAEVGVGGASLTSIGDTRLANLDATVSSRLAAAAYTAPDNTGIAAIKAKTDNLPIDPTSETNATANKNAILTRLGTPVGVSVSADIATIQAEFPANFSTLGITAGKINEFTLVDTTTAITNPVTLAASQPNYAPAKAGDAMTLTVAYDAAKTAAAPGAAMTLTGGERLATCDQILTRPWSAVEGTADPHSLGALIPAAFLFRFSSTFDTYKTDGITLFHSYNLTGSAATGSNVITSMGI